MGFSPQPFPPPIAFLGILPFLQVTSDVFFSVVPPTCPSSVYSLYWPETICTLAPSIVLPSSRSRCFLSRVSQCNSLSNKNLPGYCYCPELSSSPPLHHRCRLFVFVLSSSVASPAMALFSECPSFSSFTTLFHLASISLEFPTRLEPEAKQSGGTTDWMANFRGR